MAQQSPRWSVPLFSPRPSWCISFPGASSTNWQCLAVMRAVVNGVRYILPAVLLTASETNGSAARVCQFFHRYGKQGPCHCGIELDSCLSQCPRHCCSETSLVGCERVELFCSKGFSAGPAPRWRALPGAHAFTRGLVCFLPYGTTPMSVEGGWQWSQPRRVGALDGMFS